MKNDIRTGAVWFLVAVALVVGLAAPSVAQVAPPRLVFYQGQLRNDTGTPLSGTYNLEFRIYDALSGGNLLWGPEAHNSVVLTNGIFNRYLGSVIGLSDTVFAVGTWLEIKVGANTFSPRVQLVAVPEAFNAYRFAGKDSTFYAPTANPTFTGVLTAETARIQTIIGGYSGNIAAGSAFVGGGGISETGFIRINQATGNGSSIGGGMQNVASGRNSVVAGGDDNMASGIISFVGGGDHNTSSAYYSVVGGGFQNISSGSSSTVGGGYQNTASGNGAFVGGGYRNTAPPGVDGTGEAFVGGGDSNTAMGRYAAVVGGVLNTASGVSAFVGGGGFIKGNRATANWSAIVGGDSNNASGIGAFIGGGYSNLASGDSSAIVGGLQNEANGWGAFIGGGKQNTASAFGAVSGGFFNTASGSFAYVGGGQANAASGLSSFVGGGQSNAASGEFSTISGGFNNFAIGRAAVVGGGYQNTASGESSVVPGGYLNTAAGQFSFAAGVRAFANHNNTFVWNDSNTANFVSTASNQFLIHASGGVGIDTNAPVSKLAVAGTITAQSFVGGGTGLKGIPSLNFPDGVNGTYSNLNLGAGYTVPSGKTLYILSASSPDSYGQIRIDGTNYFQTFSDADNLRSFSFPGPLVVASGKTVSHSGTCFASVLEVDSNTVVKQLVLSSGSGYTVPAGRTLFILTAHMSNLQNSNNTLGYGFIRIGGSNYYSLQSNTSLTSGWSYNDDNNYPSHSFSVPLVVAGGNTVDFQGIVPSSAVTCSITGYEK